MDMLASVSSVVSVLKWAAVLVAGAGALLYALWAQSRLQNDSVIWWLSLVAFPVAPILFFAGAYIHVVALGLHGVAFLVSRYGLDPPPILHAESPAWFWFGVGTTLVLVTLMIVLAMGFVVSITVTWKEHRLSADPALRAAAPRGAARRRFSGFFKLIIVTACTLIVAPLVGMHVSFKHQSDTRAATRKQIHAALVFATRAEKVVDDHVELHGSFPEDNHAAGLPDAEAMRSEFVSALQVKDGTLTLTLGTTAVDDHIRGGHLIMLGPDDDGRSHWQCVSIDIDAQYLPRHCLGMPQGI